ncbi:hypothetical protein TorRG33x02_267540, partial [Trema orientale]
MTMLDFAEVGQIMAKSSNGHWFHEFPSRWLEWPWDFGDGVVPRRCTFRLAAAIQGGSIGGYEEGGMSW